MYSLHELCGAKSGAASSLTIEIGCQIPKTPSASLRGLGGIDLAEELRDDFVVFEDAVLDWREGSRRHPRNWSLGRKIFDTGVMIAFEWLSTMISNTGSLTALSASEDLNVSPKMAIFSFSSTYLLGQALGSLIFPPFTESYGRRWTNIASVAIYAIGTAVVGVAPHVAVVVLGRFISGLMSAIPTVVLGGSIEDIWDIRSRIWVIDLWVLSGVSGLAFAPSFATGFSSSDLGWRWLYYLTAAAVAVLALISSNLAESRPSQILSDQAKRLNVKYPNLALRPRDSNGDLKPSLRVFASEGLIKPYKLFFTEPFLIIVTLMSASVMAFAYLLPEALPKVYKDFGFGSFQSGLVYLTLSVGACLALLVRLWDVRLWDRQGSEVLPEKKLLGFFIAAPVQALAFWWFAWTIPPHASQLSPAISIAAVVPMGFAINEFDHVLLGYIIDTYGADAGSASAPLGFLRAVLCAFAPLVGAKLFGSLDNNLAASCLAVVATVYVVVAVGFLLYGEQFRKASRWVRRNAGEARKEGEQSGSSESAMRRGRIGAGPGNPHASMFDG